MHVIATAGHVDHGKSTLVEALTGTNPDRLEEERKRGLSIQLGYCWTSWEQVGEVAFVDVPGHERFINTMLSGIGPVPAVLLVVAADDPWMPQAAEHLAALHALGVAHGVVAVTRSDLADPAPMMAWAEREIARTSLAGSPVVPVSGVTGQGLDELRAQLVRMVQSLPVPDHGADVRLWLDRSFHVKGTGTVVTGTLAAGEVRVGDLLALGERTLRVRGFQTLGRTVPAARGVARVALNVAGDERAGLDRHGVLTTPGAWRHTEVLDVRVTAPSGRVRPIQPPRRPLLHIGASVVAAYFRPFEDGLGRLTLGRPLPVRVGDRALLRDPGSRRLWGITVLDPAPPALQRRGAAAQRAAALASVTGEPDLESEVERRGLVHVDLLRRIGVPVPTAHGAVDGWLLSQARAGVLAAQMRDAVERHDREHPMDPGVPVTALLEPLGLESHALAMSLVAPPLRVERGRVLADGPLMRLPAALLAAVAAVRADLEREPFAAPTAGRLQELGLTTPALAVAAKAGELLHLGDGIVLGPGAAPRAVELLRDLPQPFTTSQARTRLRTSRRVAMPLLQHLDRQGLTRRLPDDRRAVAP